MPKKYKRRITAGVCGGDNRANKECGADFMQKSLHILQPVPVCSSDTGFRGHLDSSLSIMDCNRGKSQY